MSDHGPKAFGTNKKPRNRHPGSRYHVKLTLVHRYLVRADIERSPEVVSALSAASMAIQEPTQGADPDNTMLELGPSARDETVTQVLDALSPPSEEWTTVVAVNAPSREEAAARVGEALARWGDVGVRVLGEEPF
jgi:hypothetical protein